MKRSHTPKDSQSVDLSTYATILANWLEATSTFYNHYNLLAPYADRNFTCRRVQSMTNRNALPANKLKTLLSKMKQELKKLLLDLDLTQTTNLTYASDQYKKLLAHTHILNRLNREAEALTRLTTLHINYPAFREELTPHTIH